MENKDLIIQDLQQRVEYLKKENSKLKKSYDQEFKDFFENERLITDQQVNGLILENGERYLIIQDLKDVIVDLNSKNKRQSEIIKELQLENSEVNKQSKFFQNAYYAFCGVILVLLIAIYFIK